MKQALMSQYEWAKGENAVSIVRKRSRSSCKFFNFSCLFRVSTYDFVLKYTKD